ncbi:MAG: hypothetical protein AVDCRST_MAG88-2588, partial [uncultured Thermomicrobiales bacterium]
DLVRSCRQGRRHCARRGGRADRGRRARRPGARAARAAAPIRGADVPRPRRPGRGDPRPLGGAAPLRPLQRRPLHGAGVGPRAGPPLADGAPAAYRERSTVGDLRPAGARVRPFPAHARLRTGRSARGGAPDGGGARGD